MATKTKIYKPMPIKWEQIIDLMPHHNWSITESALALQDSYSPKYIESRLLGMLKRDVRFCSALKAKKAQLASKHNIKSGKLIKEWQGIAFSNIEDFIVCSKGGQFSYKSWDKIPREILAAVESVKITTNILTKKQNITLKLYSKLEALEQLGKICGVFEVDNDQRRNDVKLQVLHFTLNGSNGSKKFS